MNDYEYNKVELPALEQLQALGWTHIHGSELSPENSKERRYYSDVVLEKRLAAAIQRINPWINKENLRKVMRDLLKPQRISLMETNQFIWETITQYISVEQDLGKGRRGQTVKIIDFDSPDKSKNNEFLCVNQFVVEGAQRIIPDIVLFVNGLPLAVIECKSPYLSSDPMFEGVDQLMRYANRRGLDEVEGAEKLFFYNQMMVSSHRDRAKVGTISSRAVHYLEWKDPYPLSRDQVFFQTCKPASNDIEIAEEQAAETAESYQHTEPYSQAVLISGLFSHENFLDIVQNFTVFEPVDGKIIKKIPRYQQFRAVHKTIARLKSSEPSKKAQGGVIWHTQGSGKSLTMVFLIIKMRRDPVLSQYKLVFITDRTQLDKQLTATFKRAQNETVQRAKSVANLKQLLQKDASDIVTAMVQKFQENSDSFDFPVLNESEKIIVLVDEAHRTQYGTLGMALNTALPNAPKIAFTGTPLIKSQKTHHEFGSYIDTYTIEQAVKDGATLQIQYQGREAQVKVTGDSLDSLFDEYFADYSEEEKHAIKKKYGTRQAVLEAPQRIRRVCIDLLKHYNESIQPNGYKAMIVTSSRHAAVTYKEQLDALNAPESAVIISGKHNDKPRFTPYADAKTQEQQIKDFTKPLGDGEKQSNLTFLIVKDMLLTGFDAPIAQVMYLDRKLTDHNLLQAIARVNRTYGSKARGFIVDYYGLSDYLTEALELFSREDVSGALINFKDEIPHLQHAHTRVMQHFREMNLQDEEACVLSLSDSLKRQQFRADLSRFTKQLDIVLPHEAARPFLQDAKLLGNIAIRARNRYRDEQMDIRDAGEKVRQLIEEHVYSTGVDPKIPPLDLLDADYKKQLNALKSDKSKASEIENAIKAHIRVNLEEDPEYYKALSEQLEDIIQRNREKWDVLSQLLFDFMDKVEVNHRKDAEAIGLSDIEFSFYNILMAEVTKQSEDGVVDTETQQHVIDVVQDLVQALEAATAIVEFFKKPDEIKSVEKKIKRVILNKPFGNRVLVNAVTSQFMALARVKFR